MIVKICGLTRAADARNAVEQGATAVGFVLWPNSPRCVTPEGVSALTAELPAWVIRVGVFVDEAPDAIAGIARRAGLSAVQLHGHESPAYAAELRMPVWRAIDPGDATLDAWPAETTFVLDAVNSGARGGTGQRVDWHASAAIARRRRVVLAGGLTPDNVAEAITMVRPFGVDVSSGVEQAPGIKDSEKVARFIANARAAFEACQ